MKSENKKVVIDIEDHSKKGEEIPHNAHYKIRVDKEKYLVETECITGKEILELANKTPFNRFQLNQKMKGGQVKKIDYSEKVNLTEPGIERFMTLPLDQTEG